MKWLRMSGLVLLLPHGHEGQGPEHSSARLERFLQLSADDNWQIANCTTPANFFHLLRRQLHRDFRKPLVVMSPKSLLRHKRAVSSLADMGPGSSFHRVLWDDGELVADDKVKRVVLCSGKVYYDLFEEREKRSIKDVMVLRVEQLFPFPARALTKELKRFAKAEVLWCQEEPRNQGAWTFMVPRLEEVLITIGATCARPRYVGPPDMAASAPGTLKTHLSQRARLIDDALTVLAAPSRSKKKVYG
jgi:2-oxoglutarate dehydrogenase E1 component